MQNQNIPGSIYFKNLLKLHCWHAYVQLNIKRLSENYICYMLFIQSQSHLFTGFQPSLKSFTIFMGESHFETQTHCLLEFVKNKNLTCYFNL